MIRFIDRKEELAILEKDWQLSENAFLVMYGRRRIGKTTLINRFLEQKDGIKYTAEDTNKKIQINELKGLIALYFNDEFLAKQEILDWSSLFSYLAKVLPKDKRIYLWIDEFSYVVKNDHSIVSVLQKFIDTFLRSSRIFFIASGSLFGLMSEKILSYTSPLYGRRTRDILLKQVKANYAAEFLKMDFEDILKTVLTVGGTPEYLLIASKYSSFEDFIKNEFLKKNGYFYRELYFLLSQEFKEIRTYFSILNAIAYGKVKPSEIANFVGIDAREIYPYLELLINFDFVKKYSPVIGNRKKGIYVVNDPFIDAWFNFVHRNRESIETDSCTINNQELNQFLGKRFEFFIMANIHLFLKDFTKVGKWWHKEKEIDGIAISDHTKEIFFVECKWQEKVDAEKVVKELQEKAKYVEWNNSIRKERFVIFSKSFMKKINLWQKKRVYCFDLKDVEKAIK